ncbi:NAD(P)H-hydrate epimerase [[Candida] railenensis]|uniref:NAD(P)H-hydrate epimerase n=1 Tax=[Candida] railenensis TaxID=45579 RepID=A0A9P0QL28_9ASCO|nr:NAD(P)H-hydrate epimerase [[Candida] railenensis]
MIRTLTSKAAAQLDRDLMSTGAFSIDQLMELAGLAVAQAIYKQYPPTESNAADSLLVLVGPGNNGGDGLVASRHLKLWGYNPILYYPKKSTKNELYKNLLTQLKDLGIAEIDDIFKFLTSKDSHPRLILDCLFGFSFKPPIRSPFDEVLEFLSSHSQALPPIVSVDIPSGWDVDSGPIEECPNIDPRMLISLTAPKPCSEKFVGDGKVHYLGGRFINSKIAKQYGIEKIVKLYKGDEMVVKLG